MPILTSEQTDLLIEEIKNITPLSYVSNKNDKEKALRECDSYLNENNIDISKFIPLSFYYIVKNLRENKRVKFIKENINYIKEHDEDIFLYSSLSPKSLVSFLSFDEIKELKNIDYNLFEKVISCNNSLLFNGFKHEEYCMFFSKFNKEISEVDNECLLNGLYHHNRLCFDNINNIDLNDILKIQKDYNIEFMNIILKMYDKKINSLKPSELLTFTKYIIDDKTYSTFINNHYGKLKIALNNEKDRYLREYLIEIGSTKQNVLIELFYDSILLNHDIKTIIDAFYSSNIVWLYDKNKDLFNIISLNDFLKNSFNTWSFSNDLKRIIDSYNIDDLEELLDTKHYILTPSGNTKFLEYVELKYRNNIIPDGNIEKVDDNSSVFSKNYLKNLNELKLMLKNNTISKNNDIYTKHLTTFVLFLKKYNIVNEINETYLTKIDNLFYKIVMGLPISCIYKLSNINDITLFNRLGKLEFKTDDFSLEQLEKYKVREHRILCRKYEDDEFRIALYKKLILKLMLMVGFNNAKTIIEADLNLTTLEHLVGNIKVKDIKLDSFGNPILNTKLVNLLFGDKNKERIRKMLNDKESDLYKFFPRILNEWEIISLNGKDKSIKKVIDYLKSTDISVPLEYHRLEKLFKFIGCSNNIVAEAFMLHDKMLERTYSTIPRVEGEKNGYTYEILRLDDMNGLCVGNKTDCCFTILGASYSSLKHALTSYNGRILVVKKDDEIVAHSWIFRNGDLLCLDNIETSKKINCIDFLDVYLDFADKLIEVSYLSEGENNCIKNVSIGYTNFDKKIDGIENYLCLINRNYNLEKDDFNSRLGKKRIYADKLPSTIETVEYHDSKNVQYLIRGNYSFNLGQSRFFYQDDREEIRYYSPSNLYDENYTNSICKIVDGLRYEKLKKENNINSFRTLDIDILDEVYCNNDWYIIKYKNNDIEIYNRGVDLRANNEILNITKNFEKSKILKKK